MNTRQVLDAVRDAIALHEGSERELYEELLTEAEGWKMLLQELEDAEDGNEAA